MLKLHFFVSVSVVMKESNSLQRFMFEHANIRGEIIHLDETYKTIMNQHPYPEEIRGLLGEALVACILLAGSIKFEGEISLQFHGDQRLPLLIAQCTNQLHVRAFAKYQEPENGQHADYYAAFLKGKLVLTINQYHQTQAYQSVVPIDSTSMSENLMHYFAQSEQLATKVWLAAKGDKAAGMLLQLLPDQETTQREQFWEYAVHIGETITKDELLTLDNPTILHRLYHETELRLYDARPVKFHCRCNAEKMKEVLTILGEDDLNQLIEERGEVAIHCDFCNKEYKFDAIDVTMLFRK